MNGRELKQTLKNGGHVFGIAVEGYGQPRWPRYFANLNLIDFVFLDSEHTPLNRETIAWAVQTYSAFGIVPLLRIPEISASQASMGVDAGAQGIIVPYVETVEQVKEMVGAIKYRPLKGQALETALNTGVFPSDETRDYLPNYNPDAVLVVMIESPAGVDTLDAMLNFGGVDVVLVGPHDLSISLGIPEQYHHPKFLAAIDHIVATCQAHNVGVGMHIISGTQAEALDWVNRGFNFVSLRGDTLFVARGVQEELANIRKAVGDSRVSDEAVDVGASGHGI
jgi:2-keto-3-deoxy-L-rhamnonate aldolase RhmA